MRGSNVLLCVNFTSPPGQLSVLGSKQDFGDDDGQVGVSGDRLDLAEERLGLAGQANNESLEGWMGNKPGREKKKIKKKKYFGLEARFEA